MQLLLWHINRAIFAKISTIKAAAERHRANTPESFLLLCAHNHKMY